MENYIYEKFENLCYDGNIDEIIKFLNLHNIDINYEDGLFTESIYIHDNVELLKLFINKGANIHLNNDGLFRRCAHEGKLNILNYLLSNYTFNFDKIKKTTAYTNNKMAHDLINKYSK